MKEELQLNQQLALEVLKNKAIVQLIWDRIDSNRDKEVDLGKDAKMFQYVLDSPIDNFDLFLRMASQLCGNKQKPKALKVYELLEKREIAKDTSLLEELICWTSLQLQELWKQTLNDREIEQLGFALTIFCKILKQNPGVLDNL